MRKMLVVVAVCFLAGRGQVDAATGMNRPAAAPVDVLKTADIHDFTDKWTGSLLYPSQYGIPGWPGLTLKEGRALALDEKQKSRIVKWGFPERIPYPGSVEHVRVGTQRYMPVVPHYNARTLVKNFRATELPGVGPDRIVEYAEPVYFVTKYPFDLKRGLDSFPTGLKRRPVKVVRWNPRHPPFKLDFGVLDPGVYAVRVIAATPTENIERSTRRLVLGFSINDGLGGGTNTYRKRCAAIDEFYSVVEFFFLAPETRSYQASLWMDRSSRLPLLVYNLDLHDRLALLARRAGKRSAALYDEAQRLEEWRKRGGPKPDPRDPRQRLADDADLWRQRLPLNAQNAMYGYVPGWECLFRSALVPKDATDDDMGIDLYGKQLLWNQPKAVLEKYQKRWKVQMALKVGPAYGLTRQTSYRKAWAYGTRNLRSTYRGATMQAKRYHETGDERAARSAAILLAAVAVTNLTHDSRQTMMAIDTIPLVGSGHGDCAFRRRQREMIYSLRGHLPQHAEAYDRLFPYIRDHADELAESLHRFLPWIRGRKDVIRFYDTCLLQFFADQIIAYQQYLDSPTPGWMARLIAVQQDPDITKPWVDWLFRYVWTYPNIPLGVDEIAVNAIGRDGGNRKGSVSYSLGGSFLPGMMDDLKAYVRQGGSLPLDLTDPVKFPKAEASRRFQADVCVAGGYTFLIGDVGGPNRARLSYAPAAVKADPARAPRTVSRVLSNWFGVLETGNEHDDFRFRRAAGVRVGYGVGHHHDDPLDLQIWAHGVPMCGDGGGRTGYAVPATRAVQSHNTVVSPLAMETRHRWVSTFAPISGAQYLAARVRCSGLYARQVALVDADDTGAPNSYVVDVFRVRGGTAPSYAFHGPPADNLTTNVRDRRPGDFGGFLDPASRWQGVAPDPFVATWRMRRDPETIEWTGTDGKRHTLKVPGAERMAMNLRRLGEKITDRTPRKFIRMHLLGHPGARAWGARAFCLKGEPYTNENVYVTAAAWSEKGTLFPVVFEPFAGKPFVKSVRLASPAPFTAATPVRIEVRLENGRRDVILMGSPTRDGPLEYGFLSYDARGLRRVVLVGKALAHGDVAIEAEHGGYTGTVKSVDYYAKRAVLSAPLPATAAGAVIEIGPPTRRTSYTIEKVEGRTVVFRKGMDLAMSRVKAFLDDGTPVLQSLIERAEGVTATDERFLHWWRVGAPVEARGRSTGALAAAGGSAHPTEMQPWELAIRLVGRSAPKDVLKGGDAVRLWEFGPGDAWRLPAWIQVTRTEDGRYQANGNVRAKIRIGERTLNVEP